MAAVERVADGVEVLRLRPPGRVQRLTNVYLLRAGDRVVVFESGSRGMAPAIRAAADARGGIARVVVFTMSGRPGPPRIAPPPVRPDPEAARASVRRVAELDPRTVWLGHYGPLTGDVGAQLAAAAEAP